MIQKLRKIVMGIKSSNSLSKMVHTIMETILEVTRMKINKSIGCTVNECEYHAKKDSYCSLDQINVIKHHGKAETQEATDCGSFKAEK